MTKTDKGEQIVILDKKHYIESVNKLLNDDPHITLSQDSSLQELNKNKSTIKSDALLLNSPKLKLSPSFSCCVRFYALPKVHKRNILLRPIISNFGAASYHLLKFLTTIFSPLLSANEHAVENSINFTKIIRKFSSANLTMVSFDIISFFTHVPISDDLSFLEEKKKNFTTLSSRSRN